MHQIEHGSGDENVTEELVQAKLSEWRSNDLDFILKAHAGVHRGDFTSSCRAAVGWVVENTPLPLEMHQRKLLSPLVGFLGIAQRQPDSPHLGGFSKFAERQVFERLGPIMELLEIDNRLDGLPKAAVWRQELMDKGVLTEKDG